VLVSAGMNFPISIFITASPSYNLMSVLMLAVVMIDLPQPYPISIS